MIENFTKLETPYFNVEKVLVNNNYKDEVNCDFHSYTAVSGYGCIISEEIRLQKEETIYIPNGVKYSIVGDMELIKSYFKN